MLNFAKKNVGKIADFGLQFPFNIPEKSRIRISRNIISIFFSPFFKISVLLIIKPKKLITVNLDQMK